MQYCDKGADLPVPFFYEVPHRGAGRVGVVDEHRVEVQVLIPVVQHDHRRQRLLEAGRLLAVQLCGQNQQGAGGVVDQLLHLVS